MLVTVFRDMTHTGGKALTDWHVSNVFSIHSNGAALQWLQTGKSVNKFGLAISVDSGDTYDLTSVDLKRNAVDCVILMMLGSNHHILDIQNNFTGLCFFFLYNEVYVSSNHHGGKLLRVGIPDVYGSDAFSLTKNGTAACMISPSLWVMNRMLLPSAARFFMICISSWISCGVSTAVGSSKIRISLSR